MFFLQILQIRDAGFWFGLVGVFLMPLGTLLDGIKDFLQSF
ncbi:MAG TPA: hypothetical protein VFQ43_02760 [Nitrososphaera sp.]|nr:hypothetical protein [Nitrososphaera sp.]